MIAPTSDGAVTTLNDLAVVPGYEETLKANGLDTLDALFERIEADRLDKPGLDPWRERLRLRLDVDGVEQVFYLKRFHRPPPSVRRDVLRSGSGAATSAGVEWAWMRRLTADGIHTVQPVALGEQCDGSREVRSAILTEAVAGESLETLVGHWGATDRQLVRRVLDETATLIARLHNCGYIHRDLYLSHIFFDTENEAPAAGGATLDHRPALSLIDLQRVMRPTPPLGRWIMKDLASLNYSTPRPLVSTTDRVRWLKRYLGLGMLDAQSRRLLYLIVGKTQRIASHDRRRTLRHARGETS